MVIKVVHISDDLIVFPIFKNGKSSIEYFAKENSCRVYINGQCKKLDKITVFLRDPVERYISGVHSFIEFEKRKNDYLDYDTVLWCIKNHDIKNEHYDSQFQWISRLERFYQGDISLRPVSDLLDIIPQRIRPAISELNQEQKNKIIAIENKNIKEDYYLIKMLHTTVNIKTLLKGCMNAVS